MYRWNTIQVGVKHQSVSEQRGIQKSTKQDKKYNGQKDQQNSTNHYTEN